MTDAELQSLVEQISWQFFQRPFEHTAVFNSRLRTTGGRYLLQNHNLEFNPKMLTDFDQKVLIGVIKHELIHYHLHRQALPYQHRDQTFKHELKRTGALRYAPSLATNYKYHYRCQNGHDIYRMRRINVARYVCGKCRAKLALINEKLDE